MDKNTQKILAKLEIFFKGNIKNNDDIFSALDNIFNIKKGYIYYATPESLRCEFAYKTTPLDIKLSNNDIKEIFNVNSELNLVIFGLKNKNIIAERLIVNNIVYGIILIETEEKDIYPQVELFRTCAMIISNIIKEIELTKIIKLQTEALQEGIIETAKTNEIIKKQNKKIIASDKIKTKFLSHVSHELRTPLISIIGFSELLQNPKFGTLNDKQTECIKDIQTAGINLLGMINEILDISKIESGTLKLNLRTFEINLCINETLNILKPLADKKNIQIKYTEIPMLICADYQKLQQIFFNIINNAIKFSPENDVIQISTKQTKKYTEISIKDNGCGIDKANQKKIFKKFEQINSTQNSTGLGLTITKELLELHNGKIKINSDINKGAEFIIKLPKSSI